jgi:cytochrome c553
MGTKRVLRLFVVSPGKVIRPRVKSMQPNRSAQIRAQITGAITRTSPSSGGVHRHVRTRNDVGSQQRRDVSDPDRFNWGRPQLAAPSLTSWHAVPCPPNRPRRAAQSAARSRLRAALTICARCHLPDESKEQPEHIVMRAAKRLQVVTLDLVAPPRQHSSAD